MRRKLTATICALAVALSGAAVANAQGVIPIAIFPFNDATEMGSFAQIEGDKCTQKFRKIKAMGVNVGEGTSTCLYRTSVVADSSDTSPTQDLQAGAGYEAKTPKNLQGKLFLSVLVRAGPTSGYELRVSPLKQRWIMTRDPEGPTPESTLKAGTAKFIRPKPGKLNQLRLRATGSGDAVQLLASINGKTVFGGADSGTEGAPAGRFMAVGVGNKTGAPGAGMLGTFDDVTVRIPSPF